MANRVSVEIDAQVQGFVQGMNEASNSCQKYETDTRKIQDSTVNLNKELRAAKREAQNLAAGYAQLSNEAKASTFGREMARQLEEAKRKAAEYIDLQGDLSTELKNLASDTATFDTLADGLSALGSTMSAVTGVMGIFTDDTAMMTKAVTYFTTAESIASAAIKVKNLLQKQSSLMLGVAAVQQKALTAAENLDTAAKGRNAVATTAATVAQKAFNAVAKANPYVLLATAVLSVVSAFALFSDGADEATEAQNKLTIAEENGKKASETYASTLASEYSKLMTSYTKLKAEWASLANDSQRKKFINDHKSELQSLGAEIKNVSDAEGFFKNDTNRIVQAFESRARAAALAAKAAELYRQEMEIIEKYRSWTETQGHRAGEEAKHVTSITMDPGTKYDKHPTYNNGQYYMDNGVLKYTEKGAEAANKATRAYQEMNEAYQQNQREIKNTTAAYADLIKNGQLLVNTTNSVTNHTNTNTTTTKKEISTYAEAIAEYDKLVQEKEKLNNMLKEGRVDSEFTEEFKKEINAVENQIQAIVDKWHIKAKVEVEKPKETAKAGSLKEAQDNVSKYKVDVELNAVGTPAYIEAMKNLKYWQNKEQEIQLKIDADTSDIKKGSLEWLSQKKSKWEAVLNTSVVGSDEYNRALKEINKLTKEEQKIELQIEVSGMSAVDKLMNTFEGFHAIDGVVNSFKSLTDAIEEDANAWDIFISTLSVVESIMEGINTVSQIANMLSAKSAVVKTAETSAAVSASTAVATQAAAEGTAAAPATAMTVANKALEASYLDLAAAMIFAAHASIPFAGVGLAAGFISSMLAIQASTKAATMAMMAFAEGGIVGGSSYGGDRVLARVNSGEMILNSRQQKNLFNLLDSDVMPQKGGQQIQVQGVIRGTDLLLVQKNTNKVRSKTGTQIHF